MRRLLATLAFISVSACGGDSSTGGTSFRFPAVAGVSNVEGVLNSPPGSGRFRSTCVIAQASREQSTLTGTASVSVTVAGRS